MVFLYRNSQKKYRSYKVYIIIILILMISNTIFLYFDRKLVPIIQVLGEFRAQDIITKVINQSVSAVVGQGIVYEDLVKIQRDEDGNITFMQADTMMLNQIAFNITTYVQEGLEKVKTQKEFIPLGSITNSQLLAQYGPKLRLGITPLGTVNVNFGTEFDQSGINQTRHRIFLVIDTKVKVIIPLSSNNIEVTTYVPLTEVIIVGKVPVNYFNTTRDDLLNINPLYWE